MPQAPVSEPGSVISRTSVSRPPVLPMPPVWPVESTASLGSPPSPLRLGAATIQRPSGLAATPVGSPGTDTWAARFAVSLAPPVTRVEQPGTDGTPETPAGAGAELHAATADTAASSRHQPSRRSIITESLRS